MFTRLKNISKFWSSKARLEEKHEPLLLEDSHGKSDYRSLSEEYKESASAGEAGHHDIEQPQVRSLPSKKVKKLDFFEATPSDLLKYIVSYLEFTDFQHLTLAQNNFAKKIFANAALAELFIIQAQMDLLNNRITRIPQPPKRKSVLGRCVGYGLSLTPVAAVTPFITKSIALIDDIKILARENVRAVTTFPWDPRNVPIDSLSEYCKPAYQSLADIARYLCQRSFCRPEDIDCQLRKISCSLVEASCSDMESEKDYITKISFAAGGAFVAILIASGCADCSGFYDWLSRPSLKFSDLNLDIKTQAQIAVLFNLENGVAELRTLRIEAVLEALQEKFKLGNTSWNSDQSNTTNPVTWLNLRFRQVPRPSDFMNFSLFKTVVKSKDCIIDMPYDEIKASLSTSLS